MQVLKNSIDFIEKIGVFTTLTIHWFYLVILSLVANPFNLMINFLGKTLFINLNRSTVKRIILFITIIDNLYKRHNMNRISSISLKNVKNCLCCIG